MAHDIKIFQVGGWISIWFNIATVVFLSLFDIPGIGRDQERWAGEIGGVEVEEISETGRAGGVKEKEEAPEE